MSAISAPVLTLSCPKCQKSLRVPATAQGKNGKCPACQEVFKVPMAKAAQVVPPKASPSPAPAQSKDMTFPDLGAEAPAKVKYPAPEQHGPIGAAKKGIDKGVVGGIAMIAVAVIWFVVGYMCGYIFFYPPILLIIGIVAVIKGLMTGNITGRSPTKKAGN